MDLQTDLRVKVGEAVGGGRTWRGGTNGDTLLQGFDASQEPTLWHRETYSVVCDNPHGEREWLCVCVGMIHSAVHLKLIPPRKSTLVP